MSGVVRSSSIRNGEKSDSANMCHRGIAWAYFAYMWPIIHPPGGRRYSGTTLYSLRWYDDEWREEKQSKECNRLWSRFWKIWVLQILGFFSPKTSGALWSLNFPYDWSTFVTKNWVNLNGWMCSSWILALWISCFLGVQSTPSIQILGIHILVGLFTGGPFLKNPNFPDLKSCKSQI